MSASPNPEIAASTVDEAAVRRVMTVTDRPPRPGGAANALTFAWRTMLKFKHVPEQLLDVTVTP